MVVSFRIHIEWLMIWIGRLKVECVVHLTSIKRISIPKDTTHITFCPWAQNLTTIVL